MLECSRSALWLHLELYRLTVAPPFDSNSCVELTQWKTNTWINWADWRRYQFHFLIYLQQPERRCPSTSYVKRDNQTAQISAVFLFSSSRRAEEAYSLILGKWRCVDIILKDTVARRAKTASDRTTHLRMTELYVVMSVTAEITMWARRQGRPIVTKPRLAGQKVTM